MEEAQATAQLGDMYTHHQPSTCSLTYLGALAREPCALPPLHTAHETWELRDQDPAKCYGTHPQIRSQVA